jgi:hypothetical protein
MRRSMLSTIWLPLLVLAFLVSGCGVTVTGTIPRGTPDTGDGTPSVLSTATAAPSLPMASADVAGANYAFVRDNQLWVALNRAAPRQVTHFDYSTQPEVFWHQPLWSPGDHFLAFITDAVPTGLGGGGCPAPDFGANGALYLMDAQSGQFTQIQWPTVNSNVQMSGKPHNDSWQYIFWEDATHLLAWYNGTPGQPITSSTTGNTAGLYRYDVNTHALTQVIALRSLGVATLFAPQQNAPLLLSLRYSNEQLFYQVVVHPFGQQSQLVIYRRSLQQVQAHSSEVLTIGSEAWCATPAGEAFEQPGWDVSPDGEQVVSQIIVAAAKSGASVGTIQVVDLKDGATTTLFRQAPADFLGHDIRLAWGPDSQTVVASAYHPLSQDGPYSATLANPESMQQYTPMAAGPLVWRPDSKAFALQNTDMLDVSTPSDIYVFLTGDTHGRILLTNAREFSWG